MASPARFQLATYPLGGDCSMQLSYGDSGRDYINNLGKNL
jgi:hypothetical protein